MGSKLLIDVLMDAGLAIRVERGIEFVKHKQLWATKQHPEGRRR
jgi:hypothetical protein